MSTKTNDPIDYMDLIACAAEEARDGDWTDLLPKPVGDKPLDYLAVAAAWEIERARMGLENEANGEII